MPAKSKAQQRLFGMIHAYQKGELSTEPSSQVKEMARDIPATSVDHFAGTKRKGLPGHVKKSELQNYIADTKKGPDKKLKSVNRNVPSWKREAYARGFMKAAAENGVDLILAASMLKAGLDANDPISQIAMGAGNIQSQPTLIGAAEGAPLGALLGGGLGAGLGYFSGKEPKNRWRNAAIGGALGAVPGAAAGALGGGGLGAVNGAELIRHKLEGIK